MVSAAALSLAASFVSASAGGAVCGPLDGKACRGDELLDAGVTEDEQQCCNLCHQTDGCKAWTWFKVFGKHCHLYSSCQTHSDWARVSGFTGRGPALAADLNQRYFGFNPYNDNSPLGVTMTTHSKLDIYCHSQCYNGHADCRMSASLYNSRMMVTRGGHKIKLGLERSTGYIWNSDLVERTLGKCSYMFDGASFQRYNGACGCGAGARCDNPHSAYANKCPSTDEPCKVTDPEVAKCSCDVQGVSKSVDNVQCYFKGPAFDNENITATNDQLRWMAKERLRRQNLGPRNHDPLEYWNEIVLDEKVMLPLLEKDASNVVLGFFYKLGSREGRRTAMRMRDEFVWQYHSDSDIPILAIDVNRNVGFTKEIFFADETLPSWEEEAEARGDLMMSNETLV